MVKPKVERLYDDFGFRNRAACICVRSGEENEVLLISSSKNSGKWVVPGGGVEPGECLEEAAHREVLEEAGVKGKLIRFLGWYTCHIKKTHTAVFVMLVLEEFDEWQEKQQFDRQRQWVSVKEAMEKLLTYKPLQCEFIREMYNTKPF